MEKQLEKLCEKFRWKIVWTNGVEKLCGKLGEKLGGKIMWKIWWEHQVDNWVEKLGGKIGWTNQVENQKENIGQNIRWKNKEEYFALATTIQYQGMGQYAKAIPLMKVVQRENLKAGKFCVHWDPPLEDHNTKPVLLSCAYIKCVQSWGI